MNVEGWDYCTGREDWGSYYLLEFSYREDCFQIEIGDLEQGRLGKNMRAIHRHLIENGFPATLSVDGKAGDHLTLECKVAAKDEKDVAPLGEFLKCVDEFYKNES